MTVVWNMTPRTFVDRYQRLSGTCTLHLQGSLDTFTNVVKNQRSNCAPQTRGLRQGCGLSPYLFNIFINDIIDYIDKEETHSPVIWELKIPGLLFADDLALASFTSHGLHKKIGIYDVI